MEVGMGVDMAGALGKFITDGGRDGRLRLGGRRYTFVVPWLGSMSFTATTWARPRVKTRVWRPPSTMAQLIPLGLGMHHWWLGAMGHPTVARGEKAGGGETTTAMLVSSPGTNS